MSLLPQPCFGQGVEEQTSTAMCAGRATAYGCIYNPVLLARALTLTLFVRTHSTLKHG